MRKLFLMTLALCSLTLFSCKNDNGQQNGDNNAKDNNTEATAQAGNAFELANFSITLPDGWKDTYKSDGNLNAANEAGDCTLNATYNDSGPTISQLKTYADNLSGMLKNGGETVDEAKINDKVMTIKSVKDGNVTISYAVMKEDKIGVAGSIKYPEAKAGECEKMTDTILKSITFK